MPIYENTLYPAPFFLPGGHAQTLYPALFRVLDLPACTVQRVTTPDNDFLDVQTPLFTVSSPEWARDFVIPSRIQKELNIDEIFEEFGSLPRLSHGIKKQLSNTGKKDFNELNSVYLANRDNISDILPNKASKNSTKSVLRISKSSSNRDILNSANVAYVENKYNYEVIFFTKQEKLEFCSEFKKFCR